MTIGNKFSFSVSPITLSTNYDRTPATVPTTTPYDGGIWEVENYLVRERPVSWLEERSKLENVSLAHNSAYLIGAESWQVKMRMINRDVVLPRQVGHQKIAIL